MPTGDFDSLLTTPVAWPHQRSMRLVMLRSMTLAGMPE